MYQQIITEERKVRGLAIVSIAGQIKRINKLHYKVKSQSEPKVWYDVVKEYGQNLGGREDGKWTCSCPDFTFRSVICKHIYSVNFSKELRKVVSEDIAQPIVIPSPESKPLECLKCKTQDQIVKDGKRFNKRGEIQKYLCKNCGYRFVVNIGFENAKKNPKIICASIDLYFKGISLRKVADHIKQFYGVSISDNSVLRWVQRFGEVVAPFVDSLKAPNMSGIYHVDEMMVHVRKEEMEKGHYQWLWNLMDETTRYWVTSKISQRRETEDAQAVFNDMRNKTTHAKAIVHDGLPSYNKAFRKEYRRSRENVLNVRSVSVRKQGLNSRVERLNGTLRDREKTMRGMNKAESSQKLIEAFRIYYNFCREHSTINETPAEAAGIKLELGNNKIENLLKLATTIK